MTFSWRRFALAILVLISLGAMGSVHAAGRYVLISHAPDSDAWWNTIKNSIKQAGEDYGVTVDKNGKITLEELIARIQSRMPGGPGGPES